LVQLRAALGNACVQSDRADVAAHENDGRGGAGRALAVVKPATKEQVVQLLAIATKAGLKVVPQGARTGLVEGGTADDSGTMLLLSLERLVNPIDIDPVNRTARVGAGVTLSRLNAAAAEHNLFFPIDLGADPTIGGMVSANTGGARFLRYGDVRRNLLSVEVVTAQHEPAIHRLGRECWKQNEGIDLKQLIIGTGGALGVVTEATLTLQPLPAHRLTALLALTDPAAIDQLLVALEHSWGMILTAFEGLSPAAYEAALRHVPRLRRPFTTGSGHRYFVLIELAIGGAFSEIDLENALAAGIAPLLDHPGSVIADVVIDRHNSLWELRHALSEGLRALGSVIGCDVALRRGDVAAFRQKMTSEIERDYPCLVVCDFGHIGDGGLHFNMVWPRDAGPMPEGLADAVRMKVLTRAVEHYQGSFSAEHGVGPRNIEAYRRFTPISIQRLAGSIQLLFAPEPVGRMRFGQREHD